MVMGMLLALGSMMLGADDNEYPEVGSAAWRHMFAVDPTERALPYAPLPEPDGDATRFDVVYHGELAGFDIGRIYLGVKTTPRVYDVDYTMEQRGIARWFSDGEAKSRARGKVEDGEIVEHYYFNHDFEAVDDQQYTELYRSEDSRRIRLWSNPTYNFWQPVDEETALGAIDPMAALINLGFLDEGTDGNPCDRTVKVFDGRRRFDLVMTPDGTETFRRRGRNRFEGKTWQCRLRQEKVGGYREKDMGDIDGHLWVYLAEVPAPFRTQTMAYVPVMVKARQGIFVAWLEGVNPTITAPNGRSVNLAQN